MPLNPPMEAIGAEATMKASCFPPVILRVGVGGVWGGGGWGGVGENVENERLYYRCML